MRLKSYFFQYNLAYLVRMQSPNNLRPGDNGVDHGHVSVGVLEVLQVVLQVCADASLG
jgi:hypothetical protein